MVRHFGNQPRKLFYLSLIDSESANLHDLKLILELLREKPVLWVSESRLLGEPVYLVVVPDLFSRKVLSYQLSNTLEYQTAEKIRPRWQHEGKRRENENFNLPKACLEKRAQLRFSE